MRTRYKPWAIKLLNDHPELQLSEENISDFFSLHEHIELEIGSGKGDFIVTKAQLYPDKTFITIEKVPTVSGILLQKVIENDIKNVVHYSNDIRKLFPYLPTKSIDAIYLNFSDPWPKKKHDKRRLTYIDFLKEYERILKDDGHIYFQSDNQGLYEFTKEQLALSNFKHVREFDAPLDDAQSEYEKKFIALGNKIYRLDIYK